MTVPSSQPIPGLVERLDTATRVDIEGHLAACGGDFLDDLKHRVDVGGYAQKVADCARRIEAWDASGRLVALVAVYFDAEKDQAFVTNVSVLPAWRGRGLATTLLARCERLAREASLGSLRLEVRGANAAARGLYASLGFSREAAEGGLVVLVKPLRTGPLEALES